MDYISARGSSASSGTFTNFLPQSTIWQLPNAVTKEIIFLLKKKEKKTALHSFCVVLQ